MVTLSTHLGVQQIDQVAEAAEEEDAPLVAAHAMTVQFAIDDERLLLIQGQSFHFRVLIVIGACARCHSGLFETGFIFDADILGIGHGGRRLTDELVRRRVRRGARSQASNDGLAEVVEGKWHGFVLTSAAQPYPHMRRASDLAPVLGEDAG